MKINTPLIISLTHKSLDIVKLLIDSGARLEKDDDIIHLAFSYCNHDIIDILITNDAVRS